MATAGNGRATNESGGAGGKFRKRPIRTGSARGAIEKFRKSSFRRDQGRNSAATGISELERILKQMSVSMSTRSIGTILHSYLHPTTMENLPNEILVNIFVRLLARQLAQMRSVSKSWNALLSQPSFVKSHLHRSIHNNNHHCLLVFGSDYSSYCERFTVNSSPSPHLELTDSIKLIPPNDLPTRVIGSINGLICLSKMFHSSAIHIWNPSLSAISTLPPPRSMPPRSDYETYIRFGFDPKTDDYKLVKLTGLRGTGNVFTTITEWLPVEVYSMRKGSWELITQPFPSHVTRISNTDYLCVDGHDGHLHWQNETFSKTEETIVAFDLGLETFDEIPLPDSILDSSHTWHVLGVLGGKLCEISGREDGACEVWVMEEYWVPESWVKRHVFPQITGRALSSRSIGFTLHSKLLLCEWLYVDDVGRLVLYDPIANKIKLTRTKQIAFRIVDYVDSLVWI